MPDVLSLSSLISIGINTKSKNNKLAVRDATSDNDW